MPRPPRPTTVCTSISVRQSNRQCGSGLNMRGFSADVDTWPAIMHDDIVNYLVFSSNPLYNMQQIREHPVA